MFEYVRKVLSMFGNIRIKWVDPTYITQDSYNHYILFKSLGICHFSLLLIYFDFENVLCFSPIQVGTETRDMDTSLFGRLALLKQLIKVNKEEETACEFHMSALLDMVDA